MKKIPFGEVPQFGEVWRDKDSGVTIMWLNANPANGHVLGTVMLLANPPSPIADFWGKPGDIEHGISWMYIGWERFE